MKVSVVRPSSVHPPVNISISLYCQIRLGFEVDNPVKKRNQSRTNGPINAHLTIAQVIPRYNHNNEKQEALL